MNTPLETVRWLSSKDTRCQTQETQVGPLGREDPLEKEMATHSVFLPEKSHRQRSLVGYSPWGRKESRTRPSNSTEMPCPSVRASYAHWFEFYCPLSF